LESKWPSRWACCDIGSRVSTKSVVGALISLTLMALIFTVAMMNPKVRALIYGLTIAILKIEQTYWHVTSSTEVEP